MSNSRRKFSTEKEKKLLISFDKSTKIENYFHKTVIWNEDQILEHLFQEYLLDNNIELIGNYILYLKRKDIIIQKLSKGKKLNEFHLKENDEIFVSYKPFNILPIIEKDFNNYLKNDEMAKKKKK